MMLLIEQLSNEVMDTNQSILLYENGEHKLYWLGIVEDTAFRCNVYLIDSGDDFIIIDPGDRNSFENIKSKIEKINPNKKVSGLILCHQDPDVSASMVDWLRLYPDLVVYTTPRTHVLLPYYGIKDYNFYDVVENPIYTLSSGHQVRFIEAPFLHFPGAFVSYDITSKALFSGDIWAALDIDWKLVVEDFEYHKMALDLFHKDYMASNIATRGFVQRLVYDVDVILPQHGSIIPKKYVNLAKEYLNNLKCGTDLIYPELTYGE